MINVPMTNTTKFRSLPLFPLQVIRAPKIAIDVTAKKKNKGPFESGSTICAVALLTFPIKVEIPSLLGTIILLCIIEYADPKGK